MRLKDLFHVGDKTVFTGILEADEQVTKCLGIIEVDGREYARVYVEGEVRTGTPHRDLWTKSRLTWIAAYWHHIKSG